MSCRTSSKENFKFDIELLKEDDEDHKLLKKAVKLGNPRKHQNKVTRMVPRKKLKIEDSGADTSNLLLLYGTSAENLMGILEKKFLPSIKGRFDQGVYHTDNYKYAAFYSKNFMHENSSIKRVRYLFVNKVKQTEDPETPRTYSYREYVKQKKVLQVFDKLTVTAVTIDKNA